MSPVELPHFMPGLVFSRCPEVLLALTDCGGMSGGALLTTDRTGRPRLSGIVYQAFPGSTDIIYASHADFINEDGTIVKDW
jgi:hypothetical protein